MNHGADSFCKTNASRRPEFIKSESEPIFHAETQSTMGDPLFGVALISFLRPCAQQKASFKGSPPIRSDVVR
jgi:hypothetical protein